LGPTFYLKFFGVSIIVWSIILALKSAFPGENSDIEPFSIYQVPFHLFLWASEETEETGKKPGQARYFRVSLRCITGQISFMQATSFLDLETGSPVTYNVAVGEGVQVGVGTDLEGNVNIAAGAGEGVATSSTVDLSGVSIVDCRPLLVLG
jgi:hypothetical protein